MQVLQIENLPEKSHRQLETRVFRVRSRPPVDKTDVVRKLVNREIKKTSFDTSENVCTYRLTMSGRKSNLKGCAHVQNQTPKIKKRKAETLNSGIGGRTRVNSRMSKGKSGAVCNCSLQITCPTRSLRCELEVFVLRFVSGTADNNAAVDPRERAMARVKTLATKVLGGET